MRSACVVLVVMVAATAWAQSGRKTVIVAGGDCADPTLISGAKDFRDTASRLLGGQLMEPEAVLDIVRPRPTRSMQDMERQVESAKALFYGGQPERALELVERSLVELERASPEAKPWAVTQAALVLTALVQKNLDHPKEMNDAFRRIVRLDPTFKLDPDAHPPSAIAALDAVKKELNRNRKATLQVRVDAGPAATVYVDGLAMGATPLKLELPPGTYRVSLGAPGMLSFPHRVELPRDTKLNVDLSFEGSLGVQAPLCLSGSDDGAAMKLASLVAAENVIILRNTGKRVDPPFINGALFDLATGKQERGGAVTPDRLPKLATFLITGKEQLGIERNAPVAEKKVPVADPVKLEPLPPPPPLVVDARQPTFDATSGVSTGRVTSFVLLGVGAVAILTSVVVYAAEEKSRGRYISVVDVKGGGKLPGSDFPELFTETVGVMGAVDNNRVLTGTLIGVGVGAAVAGVVGLVLFPDSSTRVSVSASPSGGAMSVSGRF